MRKVFFLGLCVAVGLFACSQSTSSESLVTQQTVMELRLVKGQPKLTATNSPVRAPYPRERLAAGARVTQDSDSLSYLRADTGAVMLLSGSANITVETDGLTLTQGRLFIDTQGGPAVDLRTPRGTLELAEGRSSVTVAANGGLEAYVLRGTARFLDARAKAGERLLVSAEKQATIERATTWDDWTLGLATADPDAQPAPYGIGTVGARAPGDRGKPRFPLVIQRLEVKVTINQDFATTEVDETFVNPSPEVVEGLYGFRVPPNAVLNRFGVDRDGLMVWGQIKEKAQALAQYESNVYAGSTEDPALLEWVKRGEYQARLYPIAAGTSRRLVTRYSEWLGRHGEQSERRLYVYPMAATGAEGTLPRVEEMTVTVDWSKAAASHVRAPRGAVVRGREIIIKAHDFTPRADVFLELYDSGRKDLVAYRAPHVLAPDDIAKDAEKGFADRIAAEEKDYVLLPLPATKLLEVPPGLDLAIVVDSSAGTDPRSLALARHMAQALLAALGPKDRAALFTGDTELRPVLPESNHLTMVDEAQKKRFLAALANVPLGGATDLGTLLASAAERLDGKRRGAVIYIGDGRPSVGEMLSKSLRERLERLPPTTRILAAGTGPEVNAPLLESLVRGGPLEIVSNGYEAALAALRLLEAANSNTWQGSQLEVPGLERLLPKQVPAVAQGEPALVVGRVSGKLGTRVSLSMGGKTQTMALRVVPLEDDGDLRRRWGEGRLVELNEQKEGRLALVDLARRYGLVTPLTSLYVATRAEAEREGQHSTPIAESAEEARLAKRSRWRPWTIFSLALPRYREEPAAVAADTETSDNKEGGTGTRAKGEEGSMGNPSVSRNRRYSVSGSKDSPDPHVARAAALREAQEFGMVGLLNQGAGGDPEGVPAPVVAEEAAAAPAAKSAPMATRNGDVAHDDAKTQASGLRSKPSGLGLAGTRAGSGRLSSAQRPREPKIAMGQLDPGLDKPKQATAPAPTPTELVVDTHQPSPCSPASNLPLLERRKLWTERLMALSGPDQVLGVYRNAIWRCEATRFIERQYLLYAMVDRLTTVAERVTLYQLLLAQPTAAAVVYRAILARIQDAQGLKELHLALGIRQLDAELLARLIAPQKSPNERVAILRELTQKWPDDLELGLRLLYALEDADEHAAARAYAQRLRRRSDAVSYVRTAVGEFYLRQAARHPDNVARDEAEARRCFGEIVEFAPEDPVARRSLGDLLLAHGWYEEAFRQYQTLKLLVPEDPTVELRMAEAAYGTGKTEEALRWTEKARTAASPDGQTDLERASLAWGTVYVAWAHQEALKAGQQDVAARLLLRGQRLRSGDVELGTRFILTWAHPELRPTLWVKTSAGERPARTMALLGIAEETASDVLGLEIRVDAEDAEKLARLRAPMTLSVITAEGTEQQKTVIKRLHFGGAKANRSKIQLTHQLGEFVEEVL